MLPSLLLIELMENKRYGVEYQPIINIINQEIYAFECLARFFDDGKKSIPPDAVFDSLHKSPLSLFQVEYEQKKFSMACRQRNLIIPLGVNSDKEAVAFSLTKFRNSVFFCPHR